MSLNYSETAQEIIDKVKCPYQVFTKENTATEVEEAYKKAVIRGREEGFVPVLVVADETFAEWLSILEDEEYDKEAILLQKRGDGEKILKERYEEYLEDFTDDINGEADEEEDMLLSELLGEKKDGEEILEFSSIISYEGDVIEETILFEIPVKKPWEVIAWLPMGGWNECPEASEMMEICQYWNEKYGAVPAVLSHDTLEFTVENLEKCKEEAWDLAKEHYAFCPDRVDQGTRNGTIGEVADCISKSNVWYFWWD